MKWSLLFALGICLSVSVQASDRTITKELLLPSMKASYSDLASALRFIQQYIDETNKPYSDTAQYARITRSILLSNQDTKLDMADSLAQSSIGSILPKATFFRFYYHLPGAPIDEVILSFSDGARSVSVSGTSEHNILSLLSIAQSSFSKYKVSFRGPGFRIIIGSVILVFAIFLPLVANFAKVRYMLPFFILSPFLSMSIWIFPWKEWFPGTLILADNTSAVVKYSAELSFIGFLLTVLTVVNPFFQRFRRSLHVGRTAQVTEAKMNGNSLQTDGKEEKTPVAP